MFTRQGNSLGVVEFPRILGIECIGAIAGYPSSTKTITHPVGTRVATCMGGLGRMIPGSYAEYTCVAETNMRPIPDTSLPIGTFAALPQMLQATWGSLVTGLDLKAGESILIRGSTSSIGLCALQLAHKIGASRIAGTTRSAARVQMLYDNGADEVFVDGGEIASQVTQSPKGASNKVLELTGPTTLKDSLRCTIQKGTVCMTGVQGGSWKFDQFMPFGDLPNRVRLCIYGGGPEDFMLMPWEELVKDVEAGRVKIPVRTFKLEDIQEIHDILEKGGGCAKMAVVVAEE
ncbi:putative zinc-binding oxidoreductase [Pseudomassariella vexata]|uniref:Putative zinc-binding oxidoreductase n=1 Tax=Pseudomassariella vexata TaxID=1141098 RepID=A0A1Y2DES5_9PEZI|nr:putative zinc-binding oxidoreductase [Pseudomassariella vexata]ORY57780.1 putative zinc-binding oxidoreductase [Pseudomassariella vexata]